MKNDLRKILVFTIAGILYIGVGISRTFMPYQDNSAISNVIDVAGYIAIAIIAFLIIVDLILYAILTKKEKNIDSQKIAYEILENRENVQEYVVKAKRELNIIIFLVKTFAIVIFLLTQIFTFAFLSYFPLGTIVMSLPSLFLNLGCLLTIFHQKNEYRFWRCKKKEDYPGYYELVEKARRNSTYKGKAYFFFGEGYNVSLYIAKRYCLIQLGVACLDTLNEEELYQVILHEFEKFGKNNIIPPKFYSYSTHFANEKIPCNYLGKLYRIKFSVLKLVASVLGEEKAVDAINEIGNTKEMAKALTKLAYFNNFEYESYKYLKPIWLYNQPYNHYWSDYIKSFRNACEERYEFWNELIKKEIQPITIAYPIIRERLEIIDENIAEIHFSTEDDPLYFESKMALAEVDKESQESLNYEEEHKKYLSALQTIKTWQNEGCNFRESTFIDIFSKLHDYNLYDKAEMLCDLALERATSERILAYANLYKGIYLLKRYDNSGIELIYKAQDLSLGLLDCTSIIGNYCCRMGLEKELATLREYIATRK